jgi:AhpD family alkylhydroperoxidase
VARVPYVEEADHPELAELIAQIKAERGGRVNNLYKLLLQSPEVCAGWLHCFTAIRYQSTLDAQTRELVITQVAVITGADYEYRAHARIAAEVGVSQQKIDALGDWEASDVFDARERAVLAYCASMTKEIHVPSDVFDAMARYFGPREIVELTATIAGYNMVSRFLEAMAIDPQS